MPRTPAMSRVPFVLQPAGAVHPSLLPVLPEWFPLAEQGPDPETGEPRPPLSEAQRRTVRRDYAMREACRGPFDGLRGFVMLAPREDPPKIYRDVSHPGYAYRFTRVRDGVLVYRYSPADSPQHAAQMAVVREALLEMGPGYIVAARETGREPTNA